MSHSIGRVIKDHKIVGYFECNDTVGFACTAIRKNTEEVHKYWRTDAVFKNCDCDKPAEDVLLTSGNSFCWKAKACMNCMAITDRISYTDYEGTERVGFPKGVDLE